MRITALRTAYVAAVLAGTAYAVVVLRGPQGIPGLLEKRQLIADYKSKNEKLNREIVQKQDRINRLAGSTVEQEFEIRKRLKLAKPGEKIYILDGTNQTTETGPESSAPAKK